MNCSKTASDNPSSIVNLFLSQSQEHPNLLCCFWIVPPYSLVQAHALSKNCSLVISAFVSPSSFFIFSTTFTSVAIAAWSEPGSHNVL